MACKLLPKDTQNIDHLLYWVSCKDRVSDAFNLYALMYIFYNLHYWGFLFLTKPKTLFWMNCYLNNLIIFHSLVCCDIYLPSYTLFHASVFSLSLFLIHVRNRKSSTKYPWLKIEYIFKIIFIYVYNQKIYKKVKNLDWAEFQSLILN